MHAFHEFVSDKGSASFVQRRETLRAAQTESDRYSDSVLICGVNWLGDSIISLPAIHAYHQSNPMTRLIMLVKPKLVSFWSMYRGFAEVLACSGTIRGTIEILPFIRRQEFSTAFILPLSFRSALMPFLACIPCRIGMTGHCRSWMLTQSSNPQERINGMALGSRHQCYEYMDVLGVADKKPEMPTLTIPDKILERIKRQFKPYNLIRIGLFPGAAYGPSKRWPADFFIKAGTMLKCALKCDIFVFGLPSESKLCDYVAQGIGAGTINLSGKTSILELAAMLSLCALVIANDSGGMHLATAVGTPVVAIFGITDPEKTGPLINNSCVLQDSTIRNANLERESDQATMSLSRIRPERVFEAACKMLATD